MLISYDPRYGVGSEVFSLGDSVFMGYFRVVLRPSFTDLKPLYFLFISCWMANNEFLRNYWDETTGCDGDERRVQNFH